MAATYVFSTDLYIGADSLEEARDGLLELLAEIVGRNNSEPFELIEMIYEETGDAELV
jgi:chorismate mutase